MTDVGTMSIHVGANENQVIVLDNDSANSSSSTVARQCIFAGRWLAESRQGLA